MREQIERIEDTIKQGNQVFWVHTGYEVKATKGFTDFNIIWNGGRHDASCIGLSNKARTSINGRLDGFFTIDSKGKENFLFTN
jgi:hypothetical protein